MKFLKGFVAGLFLCTQVFAETQVKYRKDKDNYLIVLQAGQDFIEAMKAFISKEKIIGAHFTAIGAVKNVQIAYYDIDKQDYKLSPIFEASAEVLSLSGSLGTIDKRPIVHPHIAFSGPDYGLKGGHLMKATTSLILEIFVMPTTKPIERELNKEFNGIRTIKVDKFDSFTY